MAMEFWGFEVESGVTLRIFPQADRVIHIKQVALGEAKEKKKETGFIHLKLRIGASTILMGSLSAEMTPQLSCHYVFSEPFELSHDWKNGSVYFCGHVADNVYDNYEDSGSARKPKSSINRKGNGSDDLEQVDDSDRPQEDDKGTPKKLKSRKKRPSEARLEAAQKTDGKLGSGHTAATPGLSKQGGKHSC